ncbi:efflux RND transporter periplasmic adaptor subunit [Paracoccus sp. FO-3]|uniref:efflux RND transporter periplasmic adaptor subunit n=1 Tax=Paracoccus sp. FO-3 TaxID=1335059 RepID=UPI00112B4E34|nr:efflux RND transporter periplasmic adaptor subunit [Paracoccus sp. FO-3]
MSLFNHIACSALMLIALGLLPAFAQNTSPVPIVRIETVEIPISYIVPGSEISDGRIDVSSRLMGFIEQLDVREGQSVKRGNLLVRIDPTDIDEAIRQARFGVSTAEAKLADAEADVNRYSTLAPSGAVATETLRKAQVRLGIARTALESAQSALAAAETQKNYATINSPVDGVVVSVEKRSGEMATPGSPILTVESHEVLLFRTYIAERNLPLIDTDTPVTVAIDVLGGRHFHGRIRGIVPSGDDVTRRYEINVLLPADPALVPGMFGRAEIRLGSDEAIVVPRSALVQRGGLEGVFIVEDGAARFRWLRLGRDLGDRLEVVSGLAAGENILAAPAFGLADGAAVAEARQ